MAEFLAHHLDNEYMIENLHMDQWVLYMIKTEHREKHVMVDLSVMGQSTESKRPQTMGMSIDNTGIATVMTAILPQLCIKV